MKKIVLLTGCIAIAFLLAFAVSNAKSKPSNSITQAQDTVALAYVKRNQLWPQLQDAFMRFGDRLEKPGKERITLAATLSREKDERLQARLILEFPDKLRLEEPEGITVFDGKVLKSTKKVFNKKEEDEVESLLSDSVEHFFGGHASGRAILFLGQRFRLDDGSIQNYIGPYYDIYQLEDRVTIKKELGSQTKLFYINSDTLLLERVRFEGKTSKSKVEVRFSDWQNVAGQQVPSKITRLEDGVTKTSLTLTAATFSMKANDGIFSLPN